MYIFLPIIAVSTLGILTIFLRRMPKVHQMPIHDVSAFYDSWLSKLPAKIRGFSPRHFRELFFDFLEKTLRKFKIMALKFENWVGSLAARLRKKRENGNSAAVNNEFVSNKDFSVDLNGARKSAEIQKIAEVIVTTPLNNNIAADDDLFNAQEKKILQDINNNPQNANTYKKLGFLYLQYQNYNDAKSSFEQAIKLGCRDTKMLKALEDINDD